MKKITEELLIKKGWKKDTSRHSRAYGIYGIKHKFDSRRTFNIYVINLSNTIDRDWFCHIDNHEYNSVARVDIDNDEHFNALMELMEIDYEL